jgi:hypothetical protein
MTAKKGENATSPASPKSTPTTSDRSADKPVVDTAQPPPDADGQKEQQPSTGKSERVEAPSNLRQEVAQQPGRPSSTLPRLNRKSVSLARAGMSVFAFNRSSLSREESQGE